MLAARLKEVPRPQVQAAADLVLAAAPPPQACRRKRLAAQPTVQPAALAERRLPQQDLELKSAMAASDRAMT